MTPKMIYLCRHGETAWSLSGQHTSITDLELTENGMREAERLGKALKGIHFDTVLSSPSKRAQDTAKIAGFPNYQVDDGLLEWRYGAYEGKTLKEIKQIDPTWNIFEKGGLDGESVRDVEERAKKLCMKLHSLSGNVLLFSSGHISRVIGAVWVGLHAHFGKYLKLSTASRSQLGYEHGYPVISFWNDTSHLQ